MTTLLLRLEGPMQSWGTTSHFSLRDTGRVPSKSGVLGLACAALGRPRSSSLQDLTELFMAVRVDRPGFLESDFQTALEVPRAGNSGSQTVISRRQFLADASFLVGLEGPRELLVRIHQALRSPRWPLFLGRKGYVPGSPIFLHDGLLEASLLESLRSYSWPKDAFGRSEMESLEFQIEAEEGDLIQDVPLSFELGRRKFRERRVRRVSFGPLPEGRQDVSVTA